MNFPAKASTMSGKQNQWTLGFCGFLLLIHHMGTAGIKYVALLRVNTVCLKSWQQHLEFRKSTARSKNTYLPLRIIDYHCVACLCSCSDKGFKKNACKKNMSMPRLVFLDFNPFIHWTSCQWWIPHPPPKTERGNSTCWTRYGLFFFETLYSVDLPSFHGQGGMDGFQDFRLTECT